MSELSHESDRVKALRQAVHILRDHFDTIQIVGTVVEPREGENGLDSDDTYLLGDGFGNMYARVESCREFVAKSDARIVRDINNEGRDDSKE